MAAEWQVDHSTAFSKWLELHRPTRHEQLAVLQWIVHLYDDGPPDNALLWPFDDEIFSASVPGAEVVVDCQALEYEKLIRLLLIEPFATS